MSAQIAVAIAGFAGVVAAFRNDSVHDWGPVEKFWLRLLLINSILPLALSMFGLFLLTVSICVFDNLALVQCICHIAAISLCGNDHQDTR